EEFDLRLREINKESGIDGIFALDEHASVAALKFGITNGYKIPKELSIIGFADGVWSRRLTPSLSTVSQHGPEIGEAAAHLLIKRLENLDDDYSYQTTVVKTELRHRNSTVKL
ncbi:MAG TPA: substrate-binding domain-containing protein, partial [Flavobacterium sp.]|nr:substrate-binding domain-containing protein [Flavobacterium sp.]